MESIWITDKHCWSQGSGWYRICSQCTEGKYWRTYKEEQEVGREVREVEWTFYGKIGQGGTGCQGAKV